MSQEDWNHTHMRKSAARRWMQDIREKQASGQYPPETIARMTQEVRDKYAPYPSVDIEAIIAYPW